MTFVPTPDPVQPLAAAPIHPATSPVGKAPAEQLGQVLVSIARDPAGARHMTLQLQPDALGRLQIQVDQAPDAPTRVRISAERPETLALLQRDAPQLQRALDQAGVPRETIMLSFHAAPAVATSPQASDGGQTNPQFLGTGQPHQGFADGRAPRTQPEREDGGEDITAANPIAPPGRARSGLDITA